MCATSSRRWAVTISSWTSGPNGQPSASQARQTAASSACVNTRSRVLLLARRPTPAAGEASRMPRSTAQASMRRR